MVGHSTLRAVTMDTLDREAARRLQPGSAIYFLMDENDVQRILAFDETMIGSDGIPVGESPHPRLWGTFPRVLGHYSRDAADYATPTRPAEGIDAVIVNGAITWQGGRHSGARNGQVITRRGH